MASLIKPAAGIGALCVAFWLVQASPAQAYVDPGSGSLIFQGVIGSAAIGMLAIRKFSARLREAAIRMFKSSSSRLK